MRILSGIQPSGPLHIGNYFGALRQFLKLQHDNEAYYFVANYHALTSLRDASTLRDYTNDVIVTMLALGLDPEKATLFVQSDVPETTELAWLLTAITPMSWLEKCVSFKDKVAQGLPSEHGLFAYPILQAADILLYDADLVPVGQDQKQHLEITRDVADRFNRTFGEVFKLPEPYILSNVAVVPGLDGRKMSKSYDNTIPLFEGGSQAMRAAVMRIVTDSRGPGEPKDAENSQLYMIYRAFATPEQSAAFRRALEEGLAWGEAKKQLCERIDAGLGPMRERYADFMARPERIEDILQAGAQKARRLSVPFIERLREAVGLRRSAAVAASDVQTTGKAKGKAARFVSFRDEDGKFRFRLIGGDGSELLLSEAFDDPKAAGSVITALRQPGALRSLAEEREGRVSVTVDGRVVCRYGIEAAAQIEAALASIA